jgi:hypothetical protein
MKKYPHKPDLEDMKDIQRRTENRLAKVMASMEGNIAARNEAWLRHAAEALMDLASIDYAFDNPPAEVLRKLREAAGRAATALDFGLVISPYDFVRYLGLALAAADENLIKTLAAFPRTRFTDPEEKAPESGYLLAEAEALLAGGRPAEAGEKLSAAAVTASKMNRFQKADYGDLIHMTQAIVQKDQSAWDAAVAAREKSFAKSFSRPDYQQFPEGLLDLRALGLAKLAKNAGLKPAGTIYLPAGLSG